MNVFTLLGGSTWSRSFLLGKFACNNNSIELLFQKCVKGSMMKKTDLCPPPPPLWDETGKDMYYWYQINDVEFLCDFSISCFFFNLFIRLLSSFWKLLLKDYHSFNHFYFTPRFTTTNEYRDSIMYSLNY